jgi:hypothetical protein
MSPLHPDVTVHDAPEQAVMAASTVGAGAALAMSGTAAAALQAGEPQYRSLPSIGALGVGSVDNIEATGTTSSAGVLIVDVNVN